MPQIENATRFDDRADINLELPHNLDKRGDNSLWNIGSRGAREKAKKKANFKQKYTIATQNG